MIVVMGVRYDTQAKCIDPQPQAIDQYLPVTFRQAKVHPFMAAVEQYQQGYFFRLCQSESQVGGLSM